MIILEVFLTVLALVTKVRCQTETYYRNDPGQIHFPGSNFRPTRFDPSYLTNRYSYENTARNLIYPPNRNLEPPHYSENAIVNNGVPQGEPVALRSGDDNQNIDSNNPSQRERSFALMNFGLNLISELSYGNHGILRDGNPGAGVIASPFSIAALLALLMQGSVGQTRLELAKVLNMQPDDAAIIFQRVGEIIQKRSSFNVFEMATNVFLSQSFDLERTFKNIAINSFGSEITQLSFVNPYKASVQINNWVASKTRNRIREIVNPTTIDEGTDIVLVNALYFKGIWQKKFNVNATVPRPFYLKNGEAKNALFMRTRGIFKTGYDSKSRSDIIVLPFEGEDYSLIIALPKLNTTLDFVLDSFIKATLKDYQFALKSEEIDLQLPRFIVKSNFDLKPILQKFALMETFSDSADFSGIGTFQNKAPVISSAVHSAILAIDEDGATAAAATAFAAIALINDEVPIVKVDRPFLAVVWDNKLSIPLFVGRIEDPTK